jgi:hypothetical protein
MLNTRAAGVGSPEEGLLFISGVLFLLQSSPYVVFSFSSHLPFPPPASRLDFPLVPRTKTREHKVWCDSLDGSFFQPRRAHSALQYLASIDKRAKVGRVGGVAIRAKRRRCRLGGGVFCAAVHPHLGDTFRRPAPRGSTILLRWFGVGKRQR